MYHFELRDVDRVDSCHLLRTLPTVSIGQKKGAMAPISDVGLLRRLTVSLHPLFSTLILGEVSTALRKELTVNRLIARNG